MLLWIRSEEGNHLNWNLQPCKYIFHISSLNALGPMACEGEHIGDVRINLPLFSTVIPSNSRLFLSCRPLVVITFSTGLVGVEVTSVSWLGQLTVGV